ncbi:DUF6346 domain-containing protein [Prauserella oleivorans]|uniref:DUF6346 domain-containing protein n=1 Tax=Prauserella oleivorans TaxID=1478153 RepID=A0ABW5W943_9PSEU
MSAATEARGRLVRAAVWWLVLVLGLLLVATLSRVLYGGGPEVDRVGTASVQHCAEQGPIGLDGLGTTYRCTAQVRWDDGGVEVREFPAGQLSPADTGRSVPVYLDSPDGRGQAYLGRNDSAAWSQVRVPVLILGGVAVVAAGIGALVSTYRLLRPRSRTAAEPPPPQVRTRAAEQRKAARRMEAQWPLDRRDRAAVGLLPIALRLYGLAGWCGLAVGYWLFATIPRFDAPRALTFASPWPQLERAWLVDVPAIAVVILGAVLGLLLFGMARAVRTDAARVLRYGPEYLGRNLPGKGSPEKRVADRLRSMRSGERVRVVVSYGVGAGVLALAIWAAIRWWNQPPDGAPLVVSLAGARDAVLLAVLAAILLLTVDTRVRRLARLLERHYERPRKTGGTTTGYGTS